MKITLCNLAFAENTYGPLYHFPMGLLNIATVIQESGKHSASIVDIPWLIYSGANPNNLIDHCVEKILEESSDIVGFYTRCDILPSVILTAKKLKEINGKLKIIFGGPGSTFVAQEILDKFEFVDIIVLGEGELTFLELCESLNVNDSCLELNHINGIMYSSNNSVIKTKERELICNLDEMPLPDYSFISYYKNTSTVASMEAGRGCPYNCLFCSTSNFWRKKYRIKSPDRIILEMKRLYYDFGVTSITLIHDNLIVSKKFIKELCTKIKQEISNVRWRCSGRIDNLDNEIIDLLVESGCESLYLGIESGSADMQKKINKNLNLNNIDKILSYCEEKGLNTWASFIIGFPNETIANVDDTIKLATKIRQYKTNQVVQIHVLSLEPGSELFDDNKDKLKFTNSFSDHSLFVYDKNNNDYLELIKQYPSIFSSFFSLNNTIILSNDLNSISRCAKVFLDYYPKTLEILFNVYNISPIKFLIYFCEHCKNRKNCDSKIFATLTDKLCMNVECFTKQNGIELDLPHKNVMKYEKECWNMLLNNYETIENIEIKKSNGKYIISNNIKLLKLDYNPFTIMDNLKKKELNYEFYKTYLVLLRYRLEAIKTLVINKEIYELIEKLINFSFFTIENVQKIMNININESLNIVKVLMKHKIILEDFND